MDMNKKIVTSLLIGSIAAALAACGSDAPEKQAQETASQTQERGNAAASAPEDSYQRTFEDCVFLGDSITEGLSFHEVLDEKNVLAKRGENGGIFAGGHRRAHEAQSKAGVHSIGFGRYFMADGRPHSLLHEKLREADRHDQRKASANPDHAVVGDPGNGGGRQDGAALSKYRPLQSSRQRIG